MSVLAVMTVFVAKTSASVSSVSHLSQVEKEAGVLSGLRKVRQEHSDADQQDCRVLSHFPQRLKERERQTDRERVSQRDRDSKRERERERQEIQHWCCHTISESVMDAGD